MTGAVDLRIVAEYVEHNIGHFHRRRIEKLNTLKLGSVLRRKNPYLFRAKNMNVASDLVKAVLDAFLSSSEEGIFGNWLEGLAIHVCEKVYGGRKSASPGIDMEFDRDGVRYLISIKSGPDWGNDSQVKKLIDNFNSARRVLRTSGTNMHISAVNGCCYGRSSHANTYKPNGDYHKYCGQSFWQFISGDPLLYKKIIEPIGHNALQRNQEFDEAYAGVLNRFTQEFMTEFCTEEGKIDWERLMEFNSKKS